MALSLGRIARRAWARLVPGGAKGGRARALDAALAREAATSEVLRAVASSPDDLGPVFKTIVAHAVRLCGAAEGWLFLRDGNRFKPVARIGVTGPFRIHTRDGFEPGPTYARMIEARGPIQVEERTVEWEDAERYRLRVSLGARGTKKTGLYVPMFRGEELVGAIHLHRREMLVFTDEQVALVGSFAEQAVMALENERLLSELRVALDWQDAASEVLGVISSSPGELDPAFDAMLENAMRVCAAEGGGLLQYDAGEFRLYAHKGWPQPLADSILKGQPPGPGTDLGRVIREKNTVHIVDTLKKAAHDEGAADTFANIERGGSRTQLFVPMLRDGEVIGIFALGRKDARAFSAKEIELVENFAMQAVIAVERAWLLTDLRGSVERQTATSEVLSVISSSPGELEPAFAAMLENTLRICAAKIGWLCVREGEGFRLAATLGLSSESIEVAARLVRHPGAETAVGRLVATKRAVQIEDLQSPEALARGDPYPLFAVQEGIRTVLAVPMLQDAALVGAIVIFRQEISPFSDEQVALVANFAAQAVIAIENARLLTELRESRDWQRATDAVRDAIASSPGELAPVFDTLLESATRLCEAPAGVVYRYADGGYRAFAVRGVTPVLGEILRQGSVRRGLHSVFAQIVAQKKTIHLHDTMEGPTNRENDTAPHEAAALGGIRTSLFVPMLKDDALAGVVQIFRYEVRPFTDRQIAFVESLAAQAVVGIENARLLTELRLSFDRQTATAEILRLMSSSPGELQPVFDVMLANAVGLCDATFGIIRRCDGGIFRAVAHSGVPPVLAEFMTQNPAFPSPESLLERAVRAGQATHETDLAISAAYGAGSPHTVATVQLGGAHSCVVVPMLNEGEVVGEIAIVRQEVKPFTDQQIELVGIFAAQAVIAIENARLHEELDARNRDLEETFNRQAATAEILRATASTPKDQA